MPCPMWVWGTVGIAGGLQPERTGGGWIAPRPGPLVLLGRELWCGRCPSPSGPQASANPPSVCCWLCVGSGDGAIRQVCSVARLEGLPASRRGRVTGGADVGREGWQKSRTGDVPAPRPAPRRCSGLAISFAILEVWGGSLLTGLCKWPSLPPRPGPPQTRSPLWEGVTLEGTVGSVIPGILTDGP